MGISSLYSVAAPSTPSDARTEVINRLSAGEVPTRSEVERVVQQAKQSTFRRASPSISVREIIERSGGGVLRKLTSAESDIVLDLGRREGPTDALEWAELRASLDKRHRRLLSVLELQEEAAKAPISKIVRAIPEEWRPAMAIRLREASDFFTRLASALTKNSNAGDAAAAHTGPQAPDELASGS